MNKYSKKQWLVHAIAMCKDCSWEETDYNTAVKKGRYHALKTGHTVNIETQVMHKYIILNKGEENDS